MTNIEILNTAVLQSAYDLGAQPSDFHSGENKVVIADAVGPKAKRYYKNPIPCNFVSYGGNTVAYVQPAYAELVGEYLRKFSYYACFETPSIHWLDDKLAPWGQKVCFMAEYWLPDVNKIGRQACTYNMKTLQNEELRTLDRNVWSNALTHGDPALDVLGIGAYDKGELIGLAACSADCDSMWQIGVDVLPSYRRQGVASALTGNLAAEICKQGKVPFYCCAWSNIPSARNAIRSGFYPAWAEMTVKPLEKINQFIQ